ncbi:hypothetical protein HW932_01755 [Allochromatium humboldtianum]|uniref:Uncharacterized protein n=1 Tax=Allochromatium humboldtianum TaxID=504901 RepID=A0A850R2Z1_9GAMM|nr:hypothetical protein [Allochromatium humboldtianum]NVZ07984.1 hypothetical protein [Allochromatium humboldtianum]
MKQPCTIQPCTCKHPQQDALHGPQMRVHNPTRKATKPEQPPVVRCSVCGTERNAVSH